MNLGTWLDTMRAASIPSVSSQARQCRKLGSKKEMNDLLVPGLSKRDKKQRAGSDVGEVYPTVKAYGTSEGAERAWDTRVRGRKRPIQFDKHGIPITVEDRKRSAANQERLVQRIIREGYAVGTSEGVRKAWDARGRGRFKVGMFVKHPLSAVPSKVIALHKNAIELESQTPGAKKRVRLPYTHPLVRGLKESEPPKIQSWKTRTTKHAYLDEGYGE